MTDDRARANETYGELTAHLHDAAYAFERSMQRLETLLEGDAWTKVREGFTDINAFLRTLKLDQFKSSVEKRQRLAERIRQLQPQASTRAIAAALGVDHHTIAKHLGGENSPPRGPNAHQSEDRSGEESPARLTGAEAAKRIIRFEEAPSRRAANREERLKRIVNANPPWPAGRRWPVIYADPPWRWETWSRETGLDRCPEAHYDTMMVEEIMALDVPSIAADDCVLFLWATSPLLLRAGRDVMESAWGFTYKTSIYWPKNKAGTGYWVRGKHELLLIGTRGAIPAPLPGQQGELIIEAPDLVELIERGDSMAIEAPVGAHSEKPAAFAELIERWFPDPVPKIELFARGAPRAGWTPWGNQVEAGDAGRGELGRPPGPPNHRTGQQ